MSQILEIVELGIQEYSTCLHKLRDFTNNRNIETTDQIWLLQHASVFTQGQAGKPEHIIKPGTIPVVQSDRGGQVTYHGPGQLIVYFLIDLPRKKISVRSFIDTILQAIINLLAINGIDGYTDPKAPGVYVAGKKICSIGIRVRKGYTYHGISLNVDMEMEPFARINPCGYANMQVCQISDYVQDISMAAIIEQLIPIIQNKLSYTTIKYAKDKT